MKYFPKLIRKIIGDSAETVLPYGFKGRYWLQALNTDFKTDLPLIPTFFSKKEITKLLYGSLNESKGINYNANDIWKKRKPLISNLLQRATRMDFKNYLAEDVLVKLDRASMLNSLEARAPFLDHRIIDFAFRKVPSDLKATTSNRKILLKKLARKILPKDFNIHRKQGFAIPLDSWLQEKNCRDYFTSVLLGEQNNNIFNKNFILKELNGSTKGYLRSERLFSLVLFELWRKEYKITT